MSYAGARGRAYREAHREEIALRARAYRESHREEIAALALAYQKAHPEKSAARSRAFRLRNLEEESARKRSWREANLERVAAYDRTYREANPEKRAAIQARREALKANSPRIEKIDRAYVIARDRSVCHICGRKVTRRIELDHLVPLSKGGAHTHDNLAVSHRSCNASRGAGRLPAQLLLVG